MKSNSNQNGLFIAINWYEIATKRTQTMVWKAVCHLFLAFKCLFMLNKQKKCWDSDTWSGLMRWKGLFIKCIYPGDDGSIDEHWGDEHLVGSHFDNQRLEIGELVSALIYSFVVDGNRIQCPTTMRPHYQMTITFDSALKQFYGN